MSLAELEDVHRRIDEVDDSILELLEKRAELAQEEGGLVGSLRRDEDRERSIMTRLRTRARKFPRRSVVEVWAAILHASWWAAQNRS